LKERITLKLTGHISKRWTRLF